MHQLIQLSPLLRITTPIGPFPAKRSAGDPAQWSAPPGHAYVPIEDKPAFTPTTHRIERVLTPTRDGWDIIPLTAAELSTLQAAATARAADDAENAAIRAILADLRNSVGTAAERLSRVERVLFQLAKRSLIGS